MNDIPITLICGYLGSGKTTLINRILGDPNSPQKIAVMVNDFGELNIDAALIEQRSSDENIISLTNGCVCCKIQDDLAASLEALRFKPIDRVIVEASGVAVPNKIKRQCLIPGFSLDKCGVLVDSQNFDHKRNDKYVGYLVQEQVKDADLIVLTKLDLAPDFKLLSTENQSLQDTQQISVTDPKLLELLFQAAPVEDPPARAEKHEVFSTRTLSQKHTISKSQLKELLDKMPKEIERFKGFVRTTDQTLLVQGNSRAYSLSSNQNSPARGLIVIYPKDFDPRIESLFYEWSDWFGLSS